MKTVKATAIDPAFGRIAAKVSGKIFDGLIAVSDIGSSVQKDHEKKFKKMKIKK